MPTNLRLFIAIELPASVRKALAAVQDDLRSQLPAKAVRWTKQEGIHLTLKFLGDTPPDQVDAIAQGLAAATAGFERFTLHAAGFGCFPNLRKPNVLWVGIPEVPKTLAGLHRAIDLQMARLDYERESRTFAPHLTLGRIDRRVSAADRRALIEVLAKTEVGHLGTVAVEEVVLFQSDLKPTGAVYTPLARARLMPGPAPD